MPNLLCFRFEYLAQAGTRGPARCLAMARSVALVALLIVRGASGVTATEPAAGQSIDLARAAQYFAEAEALSRQDGGRLWGVSLYGPMILVDPQTHTAVANQADLEGKLQAKDGVFVGKLPPEMGLANTASNWAGVQWTMVIWPLSDDRQERLRLMMHESFHRVQPKLGMPARDAVNNHLDSLQGRIWLELEWHALERALGQDAEARRQAIGDALYFRSFRRSLYPGAAANENALELNEGLAEYTGVKLSTLSMAAFVNVADTNLQERLSRSSGFTRSFAYTSGPVYGCLLDARSPDWRRSLTPQSDLGQLLAAAYGIKSPAPDRGEAIRRAQAYNGDGIIAQETAKERLREEEVSAARKQFVEGPVLILPAGTQFGYTFNPNALLAIDGDTTVYEGEVQASGAWGVLQSSKGFLVIRHNGPIVRVQVPAPAQVNSRPLKGDGWTLVLQKGWVLATGDRAGDYVLKPENAQP